MGITEFIEIMGFIVRPESTLHDSVPWERHALHLASQEHTAEKGMASWRGSV